MKGQYVVANNRGWRHVQLDDVTKMQKSWKEERGGYTIECRVDVFFGRLRSGKFTPVIVMNVYEQGCSISHVVDDNCDVWGNRFVETTKDEGNEFFKYLKKHGFEKVR